MEAHFPHPIFPFPSEDHRIEKGEHSPLVYILQAVLLELSADYAVTNPFTVNGVYDEETCRHVRRWRQVTGLPVSDVVDEDLWNTLADLYNARLA